VNSGAQVPQIEQLIESADHRFHQGALLLFQFLDPQASRIHRQVARSVVEREHD
jgi:hypothetical protein